MKLFLVRHFKLSVVLIAVPEGDGDDVVARVGDVGDVAVGSPDVAVIDRATRSSGDLDLNIAEILKEGHREGVAVDGGIDGRASWSVFYPGLFNKDMAVSIHYNCTFNLAPRRNQEKTDQQDDRFD